MLLDISNFKINVDHWLTDQQEKMEYIANILGGVNIPCEK